MSKVLITGGAGLIGSNLCAYLLKEGHEVVIIDNLITSTGDNLTPLLKDKNLHFFQHSVVDDIPNKVIHAIAGVEYIYHLACPTGVPNLVTLAEEMLETCSTGTKNILEIARRTGASFVLTSSSEVYGDPEVSPQKETYTGNVDTLGERSPYEEGKRFAESLVAMYARKYDVDAKIVRIFNTYGPGMNLSDSRVISTFINAVKNNKSLPVQGKGKQKRTFCYVDDLVQGLITVMEKGKRGEAYNLGNTNETTIVDLAETITTLSNSKQRIVFIPRPEHDHQSRMPALQKIKKLGWEPKISLENGLKKTLAWYKVI